jgi:hypothetical protein
MAETVWELGGHPVAASVYQALLPYRSLMVVEGGGAALRGSVERPLGLCASVLGLPEAAAHF